MIVAKPKVTPKFPVAVEPPPPPIFINSKNGTRPNRLQVSMNVKKVISSLVKSESKEIDGVQFFLERIYDENHIIKKIRIEDKGKIFNFKEKVRALTLYDFNLMIEKANLKVINIFGNYSLDEFNAVESDRLILLAQKK